MGSYKADEVEKYACEFLTLDYYGIKKTGVFAACDVNINTGQVTIARSIWEYWRIVKKRQGNLILYFHGLRFYAQFWLYYLMHDLKMTPAYDKENDGWKRFEDMSPKQFIVNISNLGLYYDIEIKQNHRKIEIRDSEKLIPIKKKDIGNVFSDFGAIEKIKGIERIKKVGEEIPEEMREKLTKNTKIISSAIRTFEDKGLTDITIGACCVRLFKMTHQQGYIDSIFPDLTRVKIESALFGVSDADSYIRKAYKGGWCYKKPGIGHVKAKGITLDCNGLYSYVMHSKSGCRYPVKYPRFWKGNFIPEEAKQEEKYFFIRIKTRFYLKKDKFPTIQIKRSRRRKGNEWLTSSDVNINGKAAAFYKNGRGKIMDTREVITLTQEDYKLFCDSYDLVQFEILDGCYFDTDFGIFDEYIDKMEAGKENAQNTQERYIYKLLLNNLSGKLATSKNRAYLAPELNKGKVIYSQQNAIEKKIGYIPAGAAITAYARKETITQAQEVKEYFFYSDTDSIHMKEEGIKKISAELDEKKLGAWKVESKWTEANFVKQKTYAQKTTDGRYIIKASGLTDEGKEIIIKRLKADGTEEEKERIRKEYAGELEKFDYLYKSGKIQKMTLKDFSTGLSVPGKNAIETIEGGAIRTNEVYTIR